jgi:uncharacterized integral membrane protein (TIGR00701 family)
MLPWLKALHLVGIILWMGGLFYLTSHLGNHAELESPEARDAFAEVERKSYYFVIVPGFLITLFAGLAPMLMQGFGTYLSTEGAWGSTFHVKLTLVVLLIVIDQVTHYKMRQLHEDPSNESRSLFMGLHGSIGLLFIIVITLMQVQIFR